jgi:DNA-binding response OmpR family regulator
LILSDEPLPAGLLVDGLLQPPYSQDELTQQIDRLANHQRFMRIGEMTLDIQSKSLLRNGVNHKLTPKLFDLLLLLASHEGHTVFRKTIMKEVWETEYMGDTRTLDVHVRWIREKIEDDPSRPRHLVTVRGAGYCFVAWPDK